MTWIAKGGLNNYGQRVGIMMLETRFPRLPGDIGNASTWPYPVKYRIVKGAVTTRVMGEEPDPGLVEPFVAAARDLEREGCTMITTSCGFLLAFQEVLAAAVRVPVATSALLQVPIVHQMLGGEHKVGVMTERAKNLSDVHFKAGGFSTGDTPIVVQGLPEDAIFPQVFIGNRDHLFEAVLRAELVEAAVELAEREPDVGAIVFECTNFVPFSHAVQEATGLPVFDIVTLVNYLAQATSPARDYDAI